MFVSVNTVALMMATTATARRSDIRIGTHRGLSLSDCGIGGVRTRPRHRRVGLGSPGRRATRVPPVAARAGCPWGHAAAGLALRRCHGRRVYGPDTLHRRRHSSPSTRRGWRPGWSRDPRAGDRQLRQLRLQPGAVPRSARRRPGVVRNDELTVDQALDRVPDAVLLSPGPGRPEDAGIFAPPSRAFAERGVPVLGVCLGHQAIGHVFGAAWCGPELMHGKTSSVEHHGMVCSPACRSRSRPPATTRW